MIGPAPAQADVQTVLRSFLLSILPTGTECFEGEDSRVSEPSADNFVIMTPVTRKRLGTNLHVYADCAFTGSISGTTLNVTAMQFGAIEIGANLFGPSVASGTVIAAPGTGTGGVGTYALSLSQTVASGPLASGVQAVTQPTEIGVQLDFHSNDMATGSDMAQTAATLLRDMAATTFFAANSSGVTPLYAEDPRQIPFINAEQQFETRWVVDAVLQADQIVTLSQQFASEVRITILPSGA
jgi:hypothetical protein